MIENNILAISKAMFNNKADWAKVTDDQKEQFFFIFNRYFAKKYLNKSQILNSKVQDKSVGMDLWFEYMRDKPYPNWFWSKLPKKEDKTDGFTEEQNNLLLKHFDLKKDELDFLTKHYVDEVIEELEYLKKLNKK